MSAHESSAVRDAADVAPPMEGSTFKRASVVAQEVALLPNTSGDPEFWTFQCIGSATVTGLWIVFSTDSSITITPADNSGLSGTTLTADVNTAYWLEAGQERSYRINPTTYFAHGGAADTTGFVNFYKSSGPGR